MTTILIEDCTSGIVSDSEIQTIPAQADGVFDRDILLEALAFATLDAIKISADKQFGEYLYYRTP